MDTPFTTQKISRSLPPGAEAALGGVPTAPPLPSSPKMDAARAAFTKANMPAASASPIGHPTFDPLPADKLQLRKTVDSIRTRLAALARFISAEVDSITPQLADLQPSAQDILATDNFDVTAAQDFLTAQAKILADLTAPPAPAKTSKPKPAEPTA